MSKKLIQYIGDIGVFEMGEFAQIEVDGEVVMTIPRKGHGLDCFARALAELANS